MKWVNQKLKHIIIRSYFLALAADSDKPLINQVIAGSVSNGHVMEFMYPLIKVFIVNLRQIPDGECMTLTYVMYTDTCCYAFTCSFRREKQGSTYKITLSLMNMI